LKSYDVWIGSAASLYTALPLIGAEWALALWLVSGRGVQLAAWVAFTAFTGFAVINVGHLWQGATDCGCFGPVSIKPAFTLISDLCIAGSLLAERLLVKPAGNLPVLSVRSLVVVAGGTLVAALGVFAVGSSSSTAAKGAVEPNRPQSWSGNPLPLLGAIAHGEPLASGNWMILFYRHDCSHCEQALNDWLDRTQGEARSAGLKRAIVEVPPYGRILGEWEAEDRGWLVTKLQETREWRFRTPVFVRLQQGRVMAVNETLTSR